MTIYDQIRELPDKEFEDVKHWVITEEAARRRQEPFVRAGQQKIITELQDSGVVPRPDYVDVDSVNDLSEVPEWVSPGTDHVKMYPTGAVVRHHGRVWESRVDLNHWEPGGVGVYDTVWRDSTPLPQAADDEGGAPASVTYADDRQYRAGEVVDYNGVLYVCVTPHYAAPGWTPENAHGMWARKD